MKRSLLSILLFLVSLCTLAQNLSPSPRNTPVNGLYNLGRRSDGILLEIGKIGAAKPVAITPYMSVSALRGSLINTGDLMPTQVNITDKKKQGIFFLSVADTASDNGGTVIRTAGGLCYKRVLTNAIDVGWFVVGDGIADDRSNLQKAIDIGGPINAYVFDVGQPQYKISGPITLRQGLSGVELNGLILPVGTGYTAVSTETTVRYKRFKLQIEGTGNTVNGLQINNPLISDFQTIRVHNLDGFGVKIVEAWDCVFYNTSIELCGNDSNYAFALTDNGDTSNMSHFLRLQVELSKQKAIYVSPTALCCIFDNIHSEKTMVSGGVKDTWLLGGNKGTYTNVRLHASSGGGWISQYARCHVDLTYGRINEFSIESYSPVIAESSSAGKCYLSNVLLDTFERTGAGEVYVEKGRINKLQGATSAVHVTDVECTNVVVGFSVNRSQALDYRGGVIGTLSNSDVNARIMCNGTKILGGSPVAENWLNNTSFNLGNQTLGYLKIYANNAVLTGNITTDNGHFEFLNNTVINGNLSCGVVLSMIFDASSYVTGSVTGFGSPTSSEFAGGFPVGRRTYNPKPGPTGPEYWTCTSAGVNNLPGTWTAH